jgi:hypothetical protein
MNNIICTFIFLILISYTQSQPDPWLTHYEKSNYLETAGYDEVIRYSKMLAQVSPWVHYMSFGTSPQGREIPLLIFDKNGNFDPETVRASGNIVLLIEAGIHPGEADGTDAVLMLMRDMIIKKKLFHLLDNVTFLFIPAFNVDGLARFGPFNRINQNGPKEMGWRATAQNLNLNRDFLKADAPEMHAWLKLFNRWLPDFFVDCHTTDGADYQYVLTYMLEIFGNMDIDLTKWQKDIYLPYVKSEMDKTGLPVFQYVSFRRWHDPRSGLISGVSPPRLSHGYTALQNRPSLLIETHSLKQHKIRVEATYYMLQYTAELLNKEYKTVKQLISTADAFAASKKFREEPFPVSFRRSSGDSVMVEFKGVEYTAERSDLTGGYWFKYSDRPKTYVLPWFNKPEPEMKVKLPEAYIIPPEWTEVIERLKMHGIKLDYLKEPAEISVETYLFKNPKWRQAPYESRHPMTNIEYEVIDEKRIYPKGSVVIDMNQRSARVIAHILEPKAKDSYTYWGFFDVIFEQKEYGETYVMEGIAREMLKKDKALKREFERKKAEDKNFAQSQWDMMNWFYSKTQYRDQKKDKYPVGKIYDRKVLEKLLKISEK